MLCAQEEMEMANSQGKKEEITPAAIFVIIVGIVVKVAIAVRWESACVMMWHLIQPRISRSVVSYLVERHNIYQTRSCKKRPAV